MLSVVAGWERERERELCSGALPPPCKVDAAVLHTTAASRSLTHTHPTHTLSHTHTHTHTHAHTHTAGAQHASTLPPREHAHLARRHAPLHCNHMHGYSYSWYRDALLLLCP